MAVVACSSAILIGGHYRLGECPETWTLLHPRGRDATGRIFPVRKEVRNSTIFEESPPLPPISRLAPLLPRVWLDGIRTCAREELSRHAATHRF